MVRISSKKYLSGSRLQECVFRIPGVCNGNSETVIPAHIRDRHTGRGQKASDISVANVCSSCHDFFDGRATFQGELIAPSDWYYYALRGLQETLEQRFEAGLLIVPVDVDPALNERPIKPRKAKEDRAKIAGRGFPKVSRKFGS